jgi:hypothetical protein
VARQLLPPKLASHQIANPHHGVLKVIDVFVWATQPLRFFLRQQLRHQRFNPLFNRLVSCHPWLLYLI